MAASSAARPFFDDAGGRDAFDAFEPGLEWDTSIDLPLAESSAASGDGRIEAQARRAVGTVRASKVEDYGVKHIRTVRDAVEAITAAIERQIEMAKEEGAKANELVYGDSVVRVMLYTILPYTQQREVFLQIASKPAAWPRLRGIFGAPPYQFLHAEDAWVLRAAGIAAHRSNMGYATPCVAASYSQFGMGHYVDIHEREYRALPSPEATLDDALPWMLDDYAGAGNLRFEVRIKKRSTRKKMAILKTREGAAKLTFPKPGDELELFDSVALLKLMGNDRKDAATSIVVVKRVVPRSHHSATAAMLATLK